MGGDETEYRGYRLMPVKQHPPWEVHIYAESSSVSIPPGLEVVEDGDRDEAMDKAKRRVDALLAQ